MIKRLDKLPKRKVTINELLDISDLVTMVDDIAKLAGDIEELVIVYTLKSGTTVNWKANGIPESRAMYLLELIKHSMLHPENDES